MQEGRTRSWRRRSLWGCCLLGLSCCGALQAQAGGGGKGVPDPELAGAKAMLERRAWPQAEAALRALVSRQPGSAEGLYLLAETLLREDKPKESLETATRAAKVARPSAAQLRLVALDYVLLDAYSDADKWIRVSLEEDPHDAESWYVLGRVRQSQGRFPDAVIAFQKSLQIAPRMVKAENNLGLAYEGLNRPEQAIAAYRQAIAWETDPGQTNEQPFLNLGIVLTDRNQFDEALALLLRAKAIAPGDGRLHGALGKLYARRGDLPAAETELAQALAAKPEDAGLHFQLGQVYRREGKTEQATAELNRSAALERQGRH